jgi:outer membrane protein assembly factor BamB
MGRTTAKATADSFGMTKQKAILTILACVLFSAGVMARAQQANPALAEKTVKLKALLAAAPVLPLVETELAIKLPAGWELGKVSWIARDKKSGLTWLIQRGDKADPVIAVDAEGRIVHSFGKGLYTIPHAIRIDAQGHVWTVDAGSSKVMEYTQDGKQVLTIDVGGMPVRKNGFAGTTDIAFAKGRIFISDGYGNARVVEYKADGAGVSATKVREWGSAGIGAGEFHLPHSIVVDENDVIYVADRENGRIEKFDMDGKFLGQIADLGRTYSLELGAGGTLWASMAPLDEATGAPGWIVELDRATGKILGYVVVPDKGGLHTVELDGEGHPMTGIDNRVVVFKSR